MELTVPTGWSAGECPNCTDQNMAGTFCLAYGYLDGYNYGPVCDGMLVSEHCHFRYQNASRYCVDPTPTTSTTPQPNYYPTLEHWIRAQFFLRPGASKPCCVRVQIGWIRDDGVVPLGYTYQGRFDANLDEWTLDYLGYWNQMRPPGYPPCSGAPATVTLRRRDCTTTTPLPTTTTPAPTTTTEAPTTTTTE